MLNDTDFKYLLDELHRPWRGYRKVRKGVMKRIRRHMRSLECTTVKSYLDVLYKNPGEWITCQACLRVTISRFFRDRQLWNCLKEKVLPDLLQFNPEHLRIWSTGCACGEEAYSMAILWYELNAATALDLLATDDDLNCLDRARTGCYSQSSLRELSPVQVQGNFAINQAGDEFCINAHLKNNITWSQHNFLQSPPESDFHLIFLRNNLLTYYLEPHLSDSLQNILKVIVPGCYLVIGSHERLPVGLSTIEPTEYHPCVFRKKR